MEYRKVETPEGWRWHWNDWLSPACPYLEHRPWTPRVIGGKLCFTACSNGLYNQDAAARRPDDERWRVFWGDVPGPWFHDVTNLGSYQERPLYIAVDAHAGGYRYLLVRDNQISQSFDHQIRYRIDGETVAISLFDPSGRATTADAIVPHWEPLDRMGSATR